MGQVGNEIQNSKYTKENQCASIVSINPVSIQNTEFGRRLCNVEAYFLRIYDRKIGEMGCFGPKEGLPMQV